MKSPSAQELTALWSQHQTVWRDPRQVISYWEESSAIDPRLLRFRIYGDWWNILADLGITLLVTREYEHLVMALRGDETVSYMSLPHPSGLAVDRNRQVVHIACTRNPNQVYDLAPASKMLERLDNPDGEIDCPLVPVRSRFYPGCFYMHDLAYIGDILYANSVGQNAVVRLGDNGTAERVWWPRCIEKSDGPVFGQNHIQLNSIAAGSDLHTSYFSASADKISARRPGHKNFPVDKRGVIFSGATREPVVRGLTRPHSVRLHNGRLWVDNSGYGELCVAENGKTEPVVRLPGWTRGLGFQGNVAFVGTSRVLPRFRQYAPGLDVEKSVCGVHAVDTASGSVLGGLIWPYANQIFAIEPVTFTSGFPFQAKRAKARENKLFYAFLTTSEDVDE